MSLVGTLLGNYILETRLGVGGMGEVYLARHPVIGKQVAIKVMREAIAADDHMAARFFSEARAVNAIRHPHIVDIIDFGHAESRLYFTMEMLEGESLAAVLANRRLTIAEALHITQQCCSALQASHVHGIVHRDIKPENIFLCRRAGNKAFVKLLDFGLAKLPAVSKNFQTGVDQIFGTPAYMSPEQCEGAAKADARSDVYSLGIVLYEMLTGRVPFAYDTTGETMIAHFTKKPLRPSTIDTSLSAELDDVVIRALEKAPAKRFQSMDELAAALRQFEGPSRVRRPEAITPRGPTMALTRKLAPNATTERELPMQWPRSSRLRLALVLAASAFALSFAVFANSRLAATKVPIALTASVATRPPASSHAPPAAHAVTAAQNTMPMSSTEVVRGPAPGAMHAAGASHHPHRPKPVSHGELATVAPARPSLQQRGRETETVTLLPACAPAPIAATKTAQAAIEAKGFYDDMKLLKPTFASDAQCTPPKRP